MTAVARAAAVVLVFLAACTFERRSPDFTCTTTDDCEGGRTCIDGWCATSASPPDASIDADPDDPDASTIDGGSCPPACSRCEQATCVIECTGASGCSGAPVVCPAGMPCEVKCNGPSSCGMGVDCTAASACTIVCSKNSSCGSVLQCGEGRCDIECSGDSSCQGGIQCGGACACDTACTGASSCTGTTTCPTGGDCKTDNACSSTPAGCDAC